MIIILDTGNHIDVFDSIDEAEGSLEAIDIESAEYVGCDENGRACSFELLKPPGTWNSGEFQITLSSGTDPSLPRELIRKCGPDLDNLSASKREILRAAGLIT